MWILNVWSNFTVQVCNVAYLHEHREVNVVLAVPLVKGFQQLQSVGLGVNVNSNGTAVLGWGLEGIYPGIKFTLRKFISRESPTWTPCSQRPSACPWWGQSWGYQRRIEQWPAQGRWQRREWQGLASLRPVKFRFYEVTVVFLSAFLMSWWSHCPMQGPHALANTTPPKSRSVAACNTEEGFCVCCTLQ